MIELTCKTKKGIERKLVRKLNICKVVECSDGTACVFLSNRWQFFLRTYTVCYTLEKYEDLRSKLIR